MSKVNVRWDWLVLGWVTVSGFSSWCGAFISVCDQPPRSTQPGHRFFGRHNEYQLKGDDASSWGVAIVYLFQQANNTCNNNISPTKPGNQKSKCPSCWPPVAQTKWLVLKRRVKAGMVRVWVAGKTVWSDCYTWTISERCRDKGLITKCYMNSSVSLTYFN